MHRAVVQGSVVVVVLASGDVLTVVVLVTVDVVIVDVEVLVVGATVVVVAVLAVVLDVGDVVEVVVLGGSSVVVVVVQPGMNVLLHPRIGSQLSVVHGLLSLQSMIRHVGPHGLQGPFAAPASHVSGYSTTPLPHTGHRAKQLGGVLNAVHGGANVTSVGARGGENAGPPGIGDPTGRVTKFRLVGSPPVVLIVAPAAMLSVFRATMKFAACVSPLVSRLPVAPIATVQPISRACAEARPDDVPFACACPLSASVPRRSGEPATSMRVPPSLPEAPPSALSVAVDAIVRSLPASMSTTPPRFGPLPEALTGAFTMPAPLLRTSTSPPAFPGAVAVVAAFRSDETATPPPADRVTQPPEPVLASAWTARVGGSTVRSRRVSTSASPPQPPLASMSSCTRAAPLEQSWTQPPRLVGPLAFAEIGTAVVMPAPGVSVLMQTPPPQPLIPPSAAMPPRLPPPRLTEPFRVSSEIIPPPPPPSDANAAALPRATSGLVTPFCPPMFPPASTSMVPPQPAFPLASAIRRGPPFGLTPRTTSPVALRLIVPPPRPPSAMILFSMSIFPVPLVPFAVNENVPPIPFAPLPALSTLVTVTLPELITVVPESRPAVTMTVPPFAFVVVPSARIVPLRAT